MSFWPHLFTRSKSGFILVLGGGGGRGLAHIGVLDALEEYGLRPDILVGSSVGSLVATMYAQQPEPKLLKERTLNFLNSKSFHRLTLPVFNHLREMPIESWLERLSAVARQSVLYGRAVTSNAIADKDVLFQLLQELGVSGSFSKLHIPVQMVSTIFPQGGMAVFSSGDLNTSLAASMAIPTIFPPVNIAGQRYVDGGVYADIPVLHAQNIASKRQCVVAVNAGSRRLGMHDPVNVLGMLDWVVDAQSQQLRERDFLHADVLIEPDIHSRLWYDFSHPEKVIHTGYQAMMLKMPALLKLLGA
ncbi:MAG: patatin-like phospholipase family protein [Mariprofundaceae bacterium]|nr:patatin-like phospholipase family protein [Mariprofundaceae bacterium]